LQFVQIKIPVRCCSTQQKTYPNSYILRNKTLIICFVSLQLFDKAFRTFHV